LETTNRGPEDCGTSPREGASAPLDMADWEDLCKRREDKALEHKEPESDRGQILQVEESTQPEQTTKQGQ
jgi:hypothetical protein